MHESIRKVLARALNRDDVPVDDMQNAVGALMDGQCSEVEIAALLTALRTKGESVDEIVGSARAMQERMTPIPTGRSDLLDTCGTGGDELHTFNISTATALVAAAVGVPVAKHGNRSVSSSSGSADVLEELGVNIQLTPEQVSRCIEDVGIGFCFAPLLHGAMKYAGPVRKQLGFPTIFNMLGPLTNPARADFQLLGTSRRAKARKLADALASLGRKHALVVCGADQLDEVSLWGTTAVFEVTGNVVTETEWTPEDLGLAPADVKQLRVESAAQSAAVIRDILAGVQGPARDIVLANVAAALVASQRCQKPADGVQQAAQAIDSGAAADLCRRLADATNA